MTGQTFGSALERPWALVKFGSNQPNGRRPGTSVAYLTDDEGDHYFGGFVEYRRSVDHASYKCWHYRYRHSKEIPKSNVLHIFNSTNKSKFGGPGPKEISEAKKAVPITEEIAA